MNGQVSVTMGRAPKTNKYNILVEVYSLQKKGVIASSTIDPGMTGGKEHLLQMISSAAGAATEYLCERYQDPQDPSNNARLALVDFARECKLMAELGQGFSAKLGKLLAGPLLPSEREALDKVKFFISRGAPPTAHDDAIVESLLIKKSRNKRR